MAPAPEMSNRDDVTLWASDVMVDDLLTRAGDWSTRLEAEQLGLDYPNLARLSLAS